MKMGNVVSHVQNKDARGVILTKGRVRGQEFLWRGLKPIKRSKSFSLWGGIENTVQTQS